MLLMRILAVSLVAAFSLTAWQDASKSKEEELLTAARQGDLAKVKVLVEAGVPVDCKNRYGITPLYYAAWGGSEEVARFLISKGADVNVRDTFYKMNALSTAIGKGNDGAARALVEGGATGAELMLGMAAAQGKKALIETILAKGKPNEAQLRNAAQTAKDKNFPEIVELLRKHGAPEPK